MTETALSGVYTQPEAVVDPYWLRMSQDLPEDDQVTIRQAAELIDRMYDLEACSGEATGGDPVPIDDEGRPEPPIDEYTFFDLVREVVGFAACMMDDGSYLCDLRLYRSHRGEDYALRLTNGDIEQVIRQEEDAFEYLDIENATSVTLEKPVLRNLVVRWNGTVINMASGRIEHPQITATGNTLSWPGSVSGRITATYRTEFDMITVRVRGVVANKEPQECRAIGFYHGMVEEVDLQAPVIDETMTDAERQTLCGGGQSDSSPDEILCYELVTHRKLCECSKSVSSEEILEEEAPCPDSVKNCPGGVSKCRHLIGSRTVVDGYVDCGESTSGISDPEYYEEQCCVEGDPPKCKYNYSAFPGGAEIVNGKEYWQGIHGMSTRFVPVTPQDGSCGTVTIEQVVRAAAAGPIIIPLKDRLVAPGAQITITAICDPQTLTWESEPGLTLTSTSGNSATFTATASFCGTAMVTVTGCSDFDTCRVRSTNGQWVDTGIAAGFCLGPVMWLTGGKFLSVADSGFWWGGFPAYGTDYVHDTINGYIFFIGVCSESTYELDCTPPPVYIHSSDQAVCEICAVNGGYEMINGLLELYCSGYYLSTYEGGGCCKHLYSNAWRKMILTSFGKQILEWVC